MSDEKWLSDEEIRVAMGNLAARESEWKEPNTEVIAQAIDQGRLVLRGELKDVAECDDLQPTASLNRDELARDILLAGVRTDQFLLNEQPNAEWAVKQADALLAALREKDE
jgi:hypothetical protein